MDFSWLLSLNLNDLAAIKKILFPKKKQKVIGTTVNTKAITRAKDGLINKPIIILKTAQTKM
ncbi:MAG: hypothetical protein GY909_11320 [Oligoflexia bacterium]|nr:hypothetical protein [Oligoflexia bacterium]